jgi:hypothetical protein
MGRLTTHVLDTAQGRPGGGIRITLHRNLGERYALVADAVTNADGRCDGRSSKAPRSRGGATASPSRRAILRPQGVALPDRRSSTKSCSTSAWLTPRALSRAVAGLAVGYSTYRGS